MSYDNWKLETPIDDSDEVMVNCDRCEKDHSIHNSNEVTVLTDEVNRYEQWCNACFNKKCGR